MALSENEKRLLAEMEAALAQDDPRLVSTLTGTAHAPQGPRALAGIALFFAGMAVLVAGLVMKVTPLGIVGFLISLSGLVLVLSILSNLRSGTMKPAQSQKGAKVRWTTRLEDRWERRNFDN
ncbi:MAG: DUF3040 domain-containing protein [Actinobacteria bacterium]|nr:DUF3040 domain-containing protein [Actinomycetota bacterium]